jgi:hypothetical protein
MPLNLFSLNFNLLFWAHSWIFLISNSYNFQVRLLTLIWLVLLCHRRRPWLFSDLLVPVSIKSRKEHSKIGSKAGTSWTSFCISSLYTKAVSGDYCRLFLKYPLLRLYKFLRQYFKLCRFLAVQSSPKYRRSGKRETPNQHNQPWQVHKDLLSDRQFGFTPLKSTTDADMGKNLYRSSTKE